MGNNDRAATSRAFLIKVLLPAWVVPGLLDWYWHRITNIEKTAGAHESITHVIMSLEAGLGMMMGLFLEVNAGVIAAMLGAAVAHESTVVWDVAYAKSRRKILQVELHTHSFLEVLPFVTVAVVALGHPEQARALFGLGDERPRYDIRFTKPPLPPAQIAAIVLTSGLLGMGPHVEELVRCLRENPTLRSSPPPPEPPDERFGA